MIEKISSPQFIHLRVHSEYSLIDGLVRIKPLVRAAAAAKMPAVAVTDNMNLFAAVKFYKAAIAAGVKPILGADVHLLNAQQAKQPFRVTLLCQNRQGYQNLVRLISKAYTEGQKQGFPQVEYAWIEEMSEGLIALSGAREGDIGQALLGGNPSLATELSQRWQRFFPDRYYIELQRTGRDLEEEYLHAALGLAVQQGFPVVATNDVRFLSEDDFEAHEARVCIHAGYVLDDPKRPHAYNAQQYLRTPEEMLTLFADIPEALENSVEIAKRCNVELDLGKNFLPQFPTPKNSSIEEYFIESAKTGLEQRFKSPLLPLLQRGEYEERLQLEIDVINRMGFASYFLIVADFIQWAKDNGIPVGPGRGSGAGSLVAYALKITDVDPLHYELLFERFLNPERVSMPDFDIDFCMDGRDRVIDYVVSRYGRDQVSQIITYGSMAAKAVVRDVGRVLGHPYGFVDKLAKLIPFELGMTLEKALAQEEILRKRYEEEEEVQLLLNLAKKLEGVTRNAGKHAGGLVIAPSALTDFLPLYCESDTNQIVTQFDKDDVETIGLVKFDFLGLRTLTIIDWAVQAINQKREVPLDITQLPTDDRETYTFLQTQSTTAVFQLESRGMKDLSKRLQLDCFEDIVALLALYRPGPLQSGMVDDFINRKHGRARVEYPHVALEAILRPTYGIILYQEQVMQIAQVLASYTLGAADLLRRAMGKKKVEEMAKQRAAFVEGAKVQGVDVQTATYIFDLMEKFAGYGFNKSHSVAYALLTYQTAWLKAHYPAEFMAAVLSSDMDHTDRVVALLEECRVMSLTVISPSIQQSSYRFTATEKGEIQYGLGAIKGVGEAAVAHIIECREQGGVFRDLFDFCQRLDMRKLNRRTLDALIRAGALDSLGAHRASLMASLDTAIQTAEQQTQGQTDLFGLQHSQAVFLEVPEWTEAQRLLGEKETLGHYISGHPLQRYEAELMKWGVKRIGEFHTVRESTLWVAGLIVAVRVLFNKRGQRMAFLTLDDRTGRIDLAIFSELYDQYKTLLVKDQLILVEGEVGVDEYSGGYRMAAQRLYTIAEAREKFSGRLIVQIQAGDLNPAFVKQLEGVLLPYRGGKNPVRIEYHYPEFHSQVQLGDEWLVRLDDGVIDDLQTLLGSRGQVRVEYR